MNNWSDRDLDIHVINPKKVGPLKGTRCDRNISQLSYHLFERYTLYTLIAVWDKSVQVDRQISVVCLYSAIRPKVRYTVIPFRHFLQASFLLFNPA